MNGRDQGNGSTIDVSPARIGDEKWILLGGLGAIFAVGVALLWRKPIPLQPSTPALAQNPAPKGRKAQRALQQQAKAALAPPPAPPPARPPAPVEQARVEVNANLDSLKDTLLRIELRRQAGTMSESEYALERGRAEQMLRDLVQG